MPSEDGGFKLLASQDLYMYQHNVRFVGEQ